MMAREIGVGIIGMGYMGRQHALAYRRVGEHFHGEAGLKPRLVIAADEDERRARESAQQFQCEDFTTDWAEVVNDPRVEILSITTPNHMHREIALAAAAKGKPFWIEKPVGRNPGETEDVARAAEKAGLINAVGLIYRQVPLVRHIRKLVRSGELGEIQQYRGTFLVDYAANPKGALTWRFQRALAGMGALGDLMSHVADMAQFICGPISEVCAQAGTFVKERPVVAGPASHFAISESEDWAVVENEDYVASMIRFKTGAMGTLEVSRVVVGPAWEMTFEVFGSGGSARWNVERMNEFELYLTTGPTRDSGYTRVFVSPEHEPFGHFQPGHAVSMGFDDLKTYEAFRFLSSVEDGNQRDPSLSDMLAAAQVLAAMERSVDSKSWERVTEVRGGYELEGTP
jgi:predicted dehydrogenase